MPPSPDAPLPVALPLLLPRRALLGVRVVSTPPIAHMPPLFCTWLLPLLPALLLALFCMHATTRAPGVGDPGSLRISLQTRRRSMLARPIAVLLSIAWIQSAVASLGQICQAASDFRPTHVHSGQCDITQVRARVCSRVGAGCSCEGAARVSGVRIVVASRYDLSL